MGWDDQDVWVDAAAGPIVRSFTATGGRTTRTRRDVAALVVTRATQFSSRAALGPEPLRILELCAQRPLAVAELSAVLGLPLNAIHVLLDDLLDRDLVSIMDTAHTAGRAGSARLERQVLQRVLDGLARL